MVVAFDGNDFQTLDIESVLGILSDFERLLPPLLLLWRRFFAAIAGADQQIAHVFVVDFQHGVGDLKGFVAVERKGASAFEQLFARDGHDAFIRSVT